MARDPNSPALAADYDALVAQLGQMRDEVGKLTHQLGAAASRDGKAMADTISSGMRDIRHGASRRAHDADVRIEHVVADNPYVALALAAGIGLLLGALARR